MDKNIILILTAACICGSYKNEMSRPEEFRGRLAQGIKEYRRPKSVAKPAYLNNYGNIMAGNVYILTKTYVRFRLKHTY